MQGAQRPRHPGGKAQGIVAGALFRQQIPQQEEHQQIGHRQNQNGQQPAEVPVFQAGKQPLHRHLKGVQAKGEAQCPKEQLPRLQGRCQLSSLMSFWALASPSSASRRTCAWERKSTAEEPAAYIIESARQSAISTMVSSDNPSASIKTRKPLSLQVP